MKIHRNIIDFFRSAAYRVPLTVTEIRKLQDGDFAVCPHCGMTLPREFMRYCDRCGQRLSWSRL